MPKDKSSGKKLADMMYGNPEGAAFGITPMIGKRREDRQDREAAKSFPVDLARGVLAGAVGIPGDIESLARLPYELYTGNESPTILPTSEDVLKRIPFGTNTPAGQFASGLGTLAGGSANLGAIPRAVKAAPGALKTAARNLSTPRTLNPQAGVIKMKGGNFLTGSVEGALKPLKRSGGLTPQDIVETEAHLEKIRPSYDLNNPKDARQLREMEDHVRALKANLALDSWVDSNLTNYIKNDMATPKDPVRLMLDRRSSEIDQKFAKDMERANRFEQRAEAEDDPRRKANFARQAQTAKVEAEAERDLAQKYISSVPSNEIDYANLYMPEQLAVKRMMAGFDPGDAAVSNAAKGWERITDDMFNVGTAGQHTRPLTPTDIRRGYKSTVDDNPWLTKLDPSTPVYYPENADSMSRDLGLDHIMDVLREDLATGRILPEQLSKVSMEQAVRRTAEYDQELAAKMSAARASARSGLPVYKEYPEGYKWVELNRPGDFAAESQAMGHSARGYEPPRGHPDWVEGSGDSGSSSYGVGGWEAIKSGKAKVYSLIDSKGEPHTTVEVEAGKPWNERSGVFYDNPELEPSWQRFSQEASLEEKAKGLDRPSNYIERYPEWLKANDPEMFAKHAKVFEQETPRVRQIKGKRNERPIEKYDPFTQDFVKSGNWSYVRDLENTGLIEAGGKYVTQDEAKAEFVPRMQKAMEFLRTNPSFEEQRAARMRRDKEMFNLDFDEQVNLESIYGQPVYPGSGYSAVELLRILEEPDAHVSSLNNYYRDISGWVQEAEKAMKHYAPPEEGMARGGRVHFSDNPDVMQLELAGGGAVRMQAGGLAKAIKALKPAKEAAVPLNIPRVRPTTKDILEAAERVGKQQAGEFVRSPLLNDTTNLAGRSKKEFDRLKKLDYKVTPIKDLPEVKPYEAKVGEVNIALPGDQTISDMLIESVDGIPIGSTSEGGANFGRGRLSDPEEKRAFWASNIVPAGAFQRKVAEIARLFDTDMVTAYHLAMGQTSNNFAQHFADANMKAIDYSKLNKEGMNLFDSAIAEGFYKKDSKTGEKIWTKFPDWPGIANPEESLEAMKQNPELRKWFNNRMKTETLTKKADLPNAKSIEYAMTEPDIRDLEINMTGLSAGRMKPGAELIPDSAHQTYSHDIPGTALGRAPELAPFSISFPDVTSFVRKEYRPQDFTGTIQKVFPHQVVDEAYLEDMYKYYTQLRAVRGFKEGGTVRGYADGGEITADDLILEERKL